MRNRTVRAMGLAAALLLPAAGWAAQAGSVPASGSTTVQQMLQRARAELKQQRAQTDALRTRVNALEQRSAANRAQLEARDRQIADLQRKLAALSAAPSRQAPSPPGTH